MWRLLRIRRSAVLFLSGALFFAGARGWGQGVGTQPARDPSSVARVPSAVVVASKPFGESYLLAEMFAQLLEARGFRVERRPGLGATEIAFGALRSGAIAVY